MSKEKEVYRRLSVGISQKSIAKSLGISDHTVRRIKKRFEDLNLTYDQVASMADDEVAVYFKKESEVIFTQERPDYEYVIKELKHKGVTLMLLWEEYVSHCIEFNKPYLKYTQFCNVVKDYAKSKNITMHIEHKPGVRCEVDWSGQYFWLYDETLRNKIAKAYLFVAVLPCSQYVFARASLDMKEENWIIHHIKMYRYFEGVPLMTVCDNCKTAIISHKNYYDLIYNKAYQEMGEYYKTAIMPARVRKPQDKASVENSVKYCETQIISRLRNEKFTNINDLNEAIHIELENINSKPLTNKDVSRKQEFGNNEKSFLLPLPKVPYEYAKWTKAIVQYNYHVAFDYNYYSVPYIYLGKKLDLRVTNTMVEIYDNNQRIVSHPRIIHKKYAYVTLKEHMPDDHKNYSEWNSERIKKWAKDIGPSTLEVINNIFLNAKYEQQVYNQTISILKLKDKYTRHKLEAAAKYILENNITPITKNFKTTIENLQYEEKETTNDINAHTVIRGASYYGGLMDDKSKLQ